MRDGHSSGTMFTHCLEQPTRTASLTLPRGVFAFQRTARVAVPIRFCSRCGLPCRRRCRRRGALLPHLFTLTRRRSLRCCGAASPAGLSRRSPKGAKAGGSFSVALSLGPFPLALRQNPAGCYPAPYVDGARTFLPRGLSALAGAAVRPTDALGMGALHHKIKPSFRDAPAWAQKGRAPE